MADLLQSQIQESCKLALPEGLKDLMSDISREVLRAQPSNLYQFIADYLSALLVARENLTIASRLCKNVCAGDCYPELDDELRYIGVNDEDAVKAKKVIVDYFEGGGANETNLMIKIAKKITIEEEQLPAIQEAVRKAFQRHLINNTTLYESSSDSDQDDVSRAAKHTLKLYRKTKHNPEEYRKTATNVQTSYRAYGVKRNKCPEQEAMPPPEKIPEKNLRFSADVNTLNGGCSMALKSCGLPTVSSTSLAGSYLHLPKYVPYSVHDKEVLDNLEETPEKENVTIDYTDEDSCSTGTKKISFQDAPQEIEDHAVMADDESDESIIEFVETEHKVEDKLTYVESEQKVKDELMYVESEQKVKDELIYVESEQKVADEYTCVESQHKIENQLMYDKSKQKVEEELTYDESEQKVGEELKYVETKQKVGLKDVESEQKVQDELTNVESEHKVEDELMYVESEEEFEDESGEDKVST